MLCFSVIILPLDDYALTDPCVAGTYGKWWKCEQANLRRKIIADLRVGVPDDYLEKRC